VLKVSDHRFGGIPIEVEFHGGLRPGQKEATKALARFDDGVLCAPTAFGKTAVAARLIAMRKVNMLAMLLHSGGTVTSVNLGMTSWC
jgi:superfamily II DNA or RNA helicase